MKNKTLLSIVFALMVFVLISGCAEKETTEDITKSGGKNHTYAICKQKSWNGILRVKILGTNTYLESEHIRESDLKLNRGPNCGKGGDYDFCDTCWYYIGPVEPIFEIQLKDGAEEKPVCSHIVRSYFIDGISKGCKDGDWEYINHNAYFPYDKERYDSLKGIKSICNDPYFEYKEGECCLDSNNNSICDKDETQEKNYQISKTEDFLLCETDEDCAITKYAKFECCSSCSYEPINREESLDRQNWRSLFCEESSCGDNSNCPDFRGASACINGVCTLIKNYNVDNSIKIDLSDKELMIIGDKYLSDNYNLPNGSVGTETFKEKQANLLFIKSNKLYLNYLFINYSIFEEYYIEQDLEKEIEEECQNSEEDYNITKEECRKRLKDFYAEEMKKKISCPIDIKPIHLTGAVGPGGRCTIISGIEDFINDLADGHKIHYIKYVLKKDPYNDEADRLVEEFIKNLGEAKWENKPIKITAMEYPISIKGLGCNPYKITVYIDKTGTTLTSFEELICVD